MSARRQGLEPAVRSLPALCTHLRRQPAGLPPLTNQHRPAARFADLTTPLNEARKRRWEGDQRPKECKTAATKGSIFLLAASREDDSRHCGCRVVRLELRFGDEKAIRCPSSKLPPSRVALNGQSSRGADKVACGNCCSPCCEGFDRPMYAGGPVRIRECGQLECGWTRTISRSPQSEYMRPSIDIDLRMRHPKTRRDHGRQLPAGVVILMIAMFVSILGQQPCFVGRAH